MCWAYGAWLAFEVVSALWRPGRLRAFRVFPALWRGQIVISPGDRPQQRPSK